MNVRAARGVSCGLCESRFVAERNVIGMTWDDVGMAERRSDRELLAADAKNDESAFNQFYRRHERAVQVALVSEIRASSVHLTDEDVEEAIQEVFLTAARKWRSINYAADGDARPWLLMVCRHVAFNRIRSARRRHEDTRFPGAAPRIFDGGDIEARFDLRREVERLEAAVAGMDAIDQAIYRAAFIEGRNQADAARILGLSPATVRQRVSRLRKRLARLRGEQP